MAKTAAELKAESKARATERGVKMKTINLPPELVEYVEYMRKNAPGGFNLTAFVCDRLRAKAALDGYKL